VREHRGVRHRARNRRSKGRKKSSALLVERRRLGPGKITSLHGGGVEAVSASSQGIGTTCTAKMHAGTRPVSGGIATGASEVRLHGIVVRGNPARETPGEEQNASTKRRAIHRSDRCVVKRTVLRSRWAAPHRVHAQRRAGDDGPEADRVRVLVDGVLGSRNGSDASLIPFSGTTARWPGRVGPSLKDIAAPSAEIPRLTRRAVKSGRTGAQIGRAILPDEALGWVSQAKSCEASRDRFRCPAPADDQSLRRGREAVLAEQVNPPWAACRKTRVHMGQR
jgi:hypothetical protein